MSSADVIRQIEQSISAHSFQDNLGRVGLRPVLTAARPNARYVRGYNIHAHSQEKRLDDIFYSLTVYYTQSPQTGEYQSHTVYFNAAGWKYRTGKTLEFYTYLNNAGDVQALIDEVSTEQDKDFVHAEVSLLLLNVDPGDIIKYSRSRYFNASGAASELELRILAITKSPARAKITFVAEVL